ncbi:flippase [Corallococcus sp. H22C18031201]|nr:flippase [Citreicoccus inhibens]RJS21369.1 flippase [Corallococcus sp. H22C18031201]
MNTQNSTPQDSGQGDSTNEVRGAVRNTLQLGGSLLVTFAIALAIRPLMARYLGPEALGYFSWADSFSATFFIVTNLGLETYIRKEVAVRPEHASDFFGTTMLVRLGMTVLLMGALAVVLHFRNEPPEVRHLVQWFALAQALIIINACMAALLHAKGKVAGLSVSNIVTKLIWGGGLALAAAGGVGLQWLAIPIVAAESVKLAVGWRLAQTHLGLRFRVDWAATRRVLKDCLPYFLTAAALACNGRVDMSLLGTLGSMKEVGWYWGAWNIASLTFLINPIFGWVLMPLMSRAASRSEAELTQLTRRSLEGTLSVTVPMMMAMVLGAHSWVRLMNGPGFDESTMPLRVLSPLFVLVYVTMVSSVWLTMMNKPWWVTAAAVMGAVLDPLLNLVLVPVLHERLGDGGGATATALCMLITELLVTALFLWRMGRASFDRRSLVMLAKTTAVCLVCFAVDPLLSFIQPWVRLGLEAFLYVALILASGAVRPAELALVFKLARNRGAPAPAPVAVPPLA